jgi:3'(2'), 5'-bisphosphate nucleotidase
MLWSLIDVARRAAAALIAGDCTGNLIIVEALRGWDETIPIVWEEPGLAADAPHRQPSRFWLVSALDGVKAFTRFESDFTVSIALIDGDRPLASVVFLPAADVVYFAGRHLGA